MEPISEALIQQVPGMVCLILVVVIFVRYLEKRDTAYMTMMQALAKQIKELARDQDAHATVTEAAIAEMRRTVAKRDRTQPAPTTDST